MANQQFLLPNKITETQTDITITQLTNNITKTLEANSIPFNLKDVEKTFQILSSTKYQWRKYSEQNGKKPETQNSK